MRILPLLAAVVSQGFGGIEQQKILVIEYKVRDY